jgi:NAD+ kinase
MSRRWSIGDSESQAAANIEIASVKEHIPEFRSPSHFDMTGVTLDDGMSCAIPTREFRTKENRLAFEGPVSHQVLLKWDEAPKRILLLAKPDDEILPDVIEAIEFMTDYGFEILLEAGTWEDIQSMDETLTPDLGRWTDAQGKSRKLGLMTEDLKGGIDLVVAFGGDGLLMHCNTLFASQSVPPVMCIDFGSLGFLSPFNMEEFQSEITRLVKESTLLLTMRMRLECAIHRADGSPAGSFAALNEVLIDRGPSPFLSNVDLFCAKQYLTTVQGDGIIIATPTGSTAYSLAAGGSMLHPSIPAILVTPICPHTLSFRPLVLPDSAVLSCVMPVDGRASGWISFDGKYRQELFKGDVVDVKMCPYPVPTVNKQGFTADWFDSLASSFNFNVRTRQKQLNGQRYSSKDEQAAIEKDDLPVYPEHNDYKKC